MKIICVEEHAIDPTTDKAARPAVLDEAPYFGLMDSPNAASRLNDLSVPLYAHPGIPLPDVQQAYYTSFPPRGHRAGRHQGIPRETPGQQTRPVKGRAFECRETVHAVR